MMCARRLLQQNLKSKTFVGTTANTVHVHAWTALIAMFILRYLPLQARFSWWLLSLVALPRRNLFVHRDLWRWLNEPFESLSEVPQPVVPTNLDSSGKRQGTVFLSCGRTRKRSGMSC